MQLLEFYSVFMIAIKNKIQEKHRAQIVKNFNNLPILFCALKSTEYCFICEGFI